MRSCDVTSVVCKSHYGLLKPNTQIKTTSSRSYANQIYEANILGIEGEFLAVEGIQPHAFGNVMQNRKTPCLFREVSLKRELELAKLIHIAVKAKIVLW